MKSFKVWDLGLAQDEGSQLQNYSNENAKDLKQEKQH